MKIAIVTIKVLWNYGNRLQNYAVQFVMKKINHNVRTLTRKQNLRQEIRHIFSFTVPKSLYRQRAPSVLFTNFDRFTKKYILEKNSDRSTAFDYYIVGSDQVWNPYFLTEDLFDFYFLKNYSSKKRIAYAASFGVSAIPDKWKLRFTEELLKFKAISVREDEGAEIVKELTGRDATVLIDPTMMMDAADWRKVAKKAQTINNVIQPYILKCFLGDQTEARRSYIQSIADKNHLAILELLDRKVPELYISGPDEFVDLVDHATLVCTDSFHATVFAILFGKPFLIMNREQEDLKDMSSRITTLLTKLHLERKMPGQVRESEIFECDYDISYRALNDEREKAYRFLKEAMSN